MADFSSLFVLFALMSIGFILRRLSLIKDEQINALPAVLLNAAYPAMILISVTSVDVKNLAQESIIVIVATLAITFVLYFAGRLVVRKYENYQRKPLLIFNLAVGNIVYVVLPVVKALFGDIGVYYALLHSTAQDVLIWTIYYGYFHSGGGRKKAQLKNLFSPCSFALAVSAVLVTFGIGLGSLAESILKPLSDITIPLALIYIGGVLGGSNKFKCWLPDKETIIVSLIKTGVIPFAVYGLMLLVPISQELRVLISFVFAAPASLMSTVWAKEFECDYEFSIKVLFFSTALFLLAMIPFFLMVKVISL